MSPLKRLVRRLTRVRGVARARHLSERVVAPYVRADVTSLHADHRDLAARHLALHEQVQQLAATMDALSAAVNELSAAARETSAAVSELAVHQPTVLNTIASTNHTARVLRRDYDLLSDTLHDLVRTSIDDLRAEVRRPEE